MLDGLYDCAAQLGLLKAQANSLRHKLQNVYEFLDKYEEWSTSLMMMFEKVMGPEEVMAAQQRSAAQRTNAGQ